MDIQITSAPQANSAEIAHQTRSDLPVTSNQAAASVVPQAQAVSPASQAAAQEQVKNAVERVNEVVQKLPHGSSVEFTVDKDTSHNVIKVIDKVTDEVIRQFPSEEVLTIAKALDRLQGLLIKDKA